MSKTLSAAAIASFDDQVHNAYQAQAGLRKFVRVKSGVVGSTHRFPKLGAGVATPRIPQTDVVPMNLVHTNVTATLSDWCAPEYTDIFDQQKTNVDERGQLAFAIANAIGRREDQLILDALDGAATTLLVASSVGGTDTNLNTSKFRKTKQLLGAGNVPGTDRIFVVHENNIFGLLGETTGGPTNADYNAVKALVDGEVQKWLGFQVVALGDRDEGGLALASGVRTCLAFHGGPRGAIGMAVGIDFRNEVNYVPEKTSWLANGIFSAGAVGIDILGIVEVSCDESGV